MVEKPRIHERLMKRTMETVMLTITVLERNAVFFESLVELLGSFSCSSVAESSIIIPGFLTLDFFAGQPLLNQLTFR